MIFDPMKLTGAWGSLAKGALNLSMNLERASGFRPFYSTARSLMRSVGRTSPELRKLLLQTGKTNLGHMYRPLATTALGAITAVEAKKTYDRVRTGRYGSAMLSAAVGAAAGIATHNSALYRGSMKDLMQTNLSRLAGKLAMRASDGLTAAMPESQNFLNSLGQSRLRRAGNNLAQTAKFGRARNLLQSEVDSFLKGVNSPTQRQSITRNFKRGMNLTGMDSQTLMSPFSR